MVPETSARHSLVHRHTSKPEQTESSFPAQAGNEDSVCSGFDVCLCTSECLAEVSGTICHPVRIRAGIDEEIGHSIFDGADFPDRLHCWAQSTGRRSIFDVDSDDTDAGQLARKVDDVGLVVGEAGLDIHGDEAVESCQILRKDQCFVSCLLYTSP